MTPRPSPALAILSIAALTATQIGCYTTRVTSDASPTAPAYEERQWFAIAGLVPLNSPPTARCKGGIGSAESELNAVDVLIVIGLEAAGALIGGAVCSTATDVYAYSQCLSAAVAIPSFLFQSRTVRYTCLGGAAAPGAIPAGGALGPGPIVVPAQTQPQDPGVEAKLRRLRDLRNAGRISDEEYRVQAQKLSNPPPSPVPSAPPPAEPVAPVPPQAPAAAPAAEPPRVPAAAGGCLKDVECKGDRICRGGTCVDP